MQKQVIQSKPKYFVAAFGDKYANTSPVNGERYPLGRLSNTDIAKGDVMLLYCTADYPGYDKKAPGIGAVVDVEITGQESIVHYRYLPLYSPVPRSTIMDRLAEDEKPYFVIPGHTFIFSIRSSSFKMVLGKRRINWP